MVKDAWLPPGMFRRARGNSQLEFANNGDVQVSGGEQSLREGVSLAIPADGRHPVRP